MHTAAPGRIRSGGATQLPLRTSSCISRVTACLRARPRAPPQQVLPPLASQRCRHQISHPTCQRMFGRYARYTWPAAPEHQMLVHLGAMKQQQQLPWPTPHGTCSCQYHCCYLAPGQCAGPALPVTLCYAHTTHPPHTLQVTQPGGRVMRPLAAWFLCPVSQNGNHTVRSGRHVMAASPSGVVGVTL